jgi:choline dehydrogenase
VQHIHAEREVILAAGAIGSPQLLQLSGVGPAAHLAEHGIPVLVDAPGVGANLTDHLLVPMAFSGRGFESPGVDAGPEEIERYLADRVGPLDSILSEALVFLRSRPELAAPDIEIVLLLGALGMHETTAQHGLSLGVVLLRPESSGTVRLRSTDPADAPLIDPAFLSDPAGADLTAVTAGVRAAQDILTEPGFAQWWEKPLTHGALSGDQGDIVDYIRRTGENIHHPVGTCRMGADPAAVLDPRLRVRGTQCLRVVDASAIPAPVRAHTHAPVTMLAERASDLIIAGA